MAFEICERTVLMAKKDVLASRRSGTGKQNTGRKSNHCHELNLVQAMKGEHSE